MDAKALIPQLLRITQEAGKAILTVYQREDVDVRQKEDASPLTEADLAAHDLIKASLQRLTPDIPFISEEQEAPLLAERKQWPTYWLVDPLDGTKEFLKRNDEFTVNIALIQHGKPVLGIVHVPVSGSTYVGIPGEAPEAYKLTGQGKQQALSTRALLSYRAVTQLGSRHHQDPLDLWVRERLENNVAPVTLTTMGSSLKFCLIAEGLADIYVRNAPCSEWDTAAAQAIVEAAGGKVLNFRFEPVRYNCHEDLLQRPFLVIGDPGRDWQQILEGLNQH
ncbi:3'(2'),5'-bisphosphate nucleotidase CysQ [Pokkaliibacter sp. CJK22405]|uniref:3'(2'),5'-bisphosphate nucleotidase CysQ n=1 Tax=Pokkaliibacter sp. CJK22405 TaxID=3384615 RepID=UPI0039849332